MTFWNEYSDTNGRGNQGANSVSYDYASKIYIGSGISSRFIELPAFVGDLKYTIDKETETLSEKDKQGTVYIEKVSTVSMSLSLDVPANSVQEAKHNLLRISEIMRMISTNTVVTGTSTENSTNSRIYILFSNLISRGGFKNPDTITSFSSLKKYGLPGYIKDFDYTPDVEAGFFLDNQYRAPRNIKVSITMSIETIPSDDTTRTTTTERDSDTGKITKTTTVTTKENWTNVGTESTRWVIRALASSGEFTHGDNGGFPFGVKIRDSRHRSRDYTYQQLNSFEDKNYADQVGSYFMIGNWYSKQLGSRPKRGTMLLNELYGNQFDLSYHTPAYCSFRMFLEDYKFSKKTNLELQKIDGSDVGVFYSNFSDENSEFDIKFSIIADSLDQAKKNCGKIQILFRLLFAENQFTLAGEDTNKKIDHKTLSDTKRRVYAPNLFENSRSTKSSAGSVANLLYNNGVGCQLLKVDVNIMNDLGFFIEQNESKKYYPKGFTISINGSVVGIDPNNLSGHPGNYNTDGSTLQNAGESIQFPFKLK